MTQPKLAVTDLSTGDRYYDNGNGRKYKSVTSVLNMLPKQLFLVPWAAKVVAENACYIMDGIENGGGEDYLYPYFDEDECEFDFELMAEDLKNSWKWERDDAGGIGDEVHNSIDQLIEITKCKKSIVRDVFDAMVDEWGISSEAKKRVSHFVTFCEENDVVPVGNEFTVFNDSFGYAGTCDLAAWVNGEAMFIDFKTSRSVHPDTALQLTAYRNGEYVVGDNSAREVPFSDIDSVVGCVLHLKSKSAKLIEFDISDKPFNAFITLLDLSRIWGDDLSKTAIGKTVWEG